MGKRVGSAWGRGLCLVKMPGGLEICVGALPAGSSQAQALPGTASGSFSSRCPSLPSARGLVLEDREEARLPLLYLGRGFDRPPAVRHTSVSGCHGHRLFCVPDVIRLFSGCSRWAVSSVMTRQNQIPTEDGSRVTLALIPLWDMCNHTNGLVMPSSVSCLIWGRCWVPLDSGHSTYKPFAPLPAFSKGGRGPPAARRQRLAFLRVHLTLKTVNLNLTSLSKNHSEMHLFAKP